MHLKAFLTLDYWPITFHVKPHRYIPDFGVGEAPTWNSSLQGLLRRSSLLEPTFRSMNKQHPSAYVAGLENPGADLALVSQINMQTYPAFNMVGYLDFSKANVRGRGYFFVSIAVRLRLLPLLLLCTVDIIVGSRVRKKSAHNSNIISTVLQ